MEQNGRREDDPERRAALRDGYQALRDLLEAFLHARNKPDVAYFDNTSGQRSFQTVFLNCEPQAEHIDNPLIHDQRDIDEVEALVESTANRTLTDLIDIVGDMPDDIASAFGFPDVATVEIIFEKAVARQEGFYYGDAVETAQFAGITVAVDIFGGYLDGTSVGRITLRDVFLKRHLYVVSRNNYALFALSKIEPNLDDLLNECRQVFGEGTRLVNVARGEFAGELAAALAEIELAARSFVPEEIIESLFERVRESALISRKHRSYFDEASEEEVMRANQILAQLNAR